LNIWRTFLSELNERQQLKWSESFLHGSFAPAKKGAAESEKPSGVASTYRTHAPGALFDRAGRLLEEGPTWQR
jgi:hypothetical protein